MKKIIVFVLILVLVLSLTACGEKSDSTDSKTEPVQEQTEAADPSTDETEAPIEDNLSFIDSGEVYFDINLSSGIFDDLTIKIGDQELTKTGKIVFNGTDKPIVEGTGNGSDIYVVFYTGPSVMFDEVVVSTDDLQKSLEIFFRSLIDEKTYILISDKADGFDHNLNSALTEYLSQHITE